MPSLISKTVPIFFCTVWDINPFFTEYIIILSGYGIIFYVKISELLKLCQIFLKNIEGNNAE